MHRLFKIGEISRLYRIGVDSLRYYEQIGLICPRRSESGYRLYSDREIWQLNVIRDLRQLGFSMESIQRYMAFQNVDTAVSLLEEEQQAIAEKMQTLQKLRENVEKRLSTIRIARELELDTIVLREFPPRNCYRMQKGYSREHEMDILIKELINRSGNQLYIIGSNQIGSVISVDAVLSGQEPVYQSVLAIDDRGTDQLPGGKYLCLSYRGGYEKTAPWIGKMAARAEAMGLSAAGDVLELLWIDVHTTQSPEEYITELQLPVREAGEKERRETQASACGKGEKAL